MNKARLDGRLSEPGRLIVQVIARDGRVREAARALPADQFEVVFSMDRQHALSMLGEKRCDIVVVELEVGGFGIVRELRDIPSAQAAGVIMLCDRPHDRWLSMQAGADEVIVKPLEDITTLKDAIQRLIATERATRD